MMELIALFLDMGFAIHFATTASKTNYSKDLETKGIYVHSIALNNDGFDDFIKNLQPSVVLFDRFIAEEQFGWRVAAHCPKALRILDTEDLHFLRKAREVAYTTNSTLNLYTESAKRELASIFRSDLSLIISSKEMELLTSIFQIPEGLLWYLPFLADDHHGQLVAYEDRVDFVTVGNFQHAPNVDSVKRLHQEIWPMLRKQIPNSKLHVYGAYVPKTIQQLYNEETGFLIHGWAPDVQEVLQKARVCLAPLQFGAGLKGKLWDATLVGTPTVSTSVGAEGFFGMVSVEDSTEDFVHKSVELYKNKDTWYAQQQLAFRVVSEHFDRSMFAPQFQQKVSQLLQGLEAHRKQFFIGQIFQHQTLHATKYLSKWITAKNKLENKG